MAEIVRDATVERAISVQRTVRTRNSELPAHAKKWKEAKTRASEMAGLGLDASGEHEMYRRMVVGTALDLMEIGASRVEHPDEVGDWSKHLLQKRFNAETAVGIKKLAEAQYYSSESVARSYDRLAKSVKLFLNKKGFDDKTLAGMSESDIDAQLFDNLKGIGEKVKEFLISDDGLVRVLKDVEGVMEDNGYMLDPKLGKNTRLRFVNSSIAETERILREEGIRQEDWGLVRQCDLTIEYLTLLKSEVEGAKLSSTSEDCFIDFIGKHVLLDGLLHVGEDGRVEMDSGVFEIVKDAEGRAEVDPATGGKMYKNPELARRVRRQIETNMEDLLMIVSGGEFDNIGDINGLLYDKAQVLLSDYVREREVGVFGEGLDLPNGRKSWLRDIKHTVGGYVCKAILESGDKVNRDVLGTLNPQKIDRLLPRAADGLGVDVIVNLSSDETVQKVLRQICDIDMDGGFVRIENQNGFSDCDTKQALKTQVEEMAESLTNNNEMYKNGTDEYREEIDRLVDWLHIRAKIYSELITRVGGRYGELIPKGKENFNGRLKIVEELLDEVKRSGAPPGALSIMEQCSKLFALSMSKDVEPEIRATLNARMHLYFMAYHMNAAGGAIGERGASIDDAHAQGWKEQMLLNPDDLEHLLAGGANGLIVGESFNIIEWANHGDNYFKTLAEIMGINVSKLKYGEDGRGNNYDTISMSESVGNGAFVDLRVDSDAGKLLIKLKKSGANFLGISEKVSDLDYLKAWTNEKRFEFLSVSLGEPKEITMNQIQNEESFFWGRRARENSGEDPVSYNLQMDSNGERKNMVKDFFLDIVKNMNDPKGKVNTKLDVVSFVGRGVDRSKVKARTGRHDMEVGWETAETLLMALGEDCLFCPVIRAGDDYAEHVVVAEAGQAYRLKKMKVDGTHSVQGKFVTFGRTYLRSNAFEYRKENGRVVVDEKDKPIVIRKGPFTILTVDEIDFGLMREPKRDTAYFHIPLLTKKIVPVYEILVKKAISAKDVTTAEFFQKLYDPTSKIAEYGQYIFREPIVDEVGGEKQVVRYRALEVSGGNLKNMATEIRQSIYEHLVYCSGELGNRFTEADNFILNAVATEEQIMEIKLKKEPGPRKKEPFVTKEYADEVGNRDEVKAARDYVIGILRQEEEIKTNIMGEVFGAALKQVVGGK